MLIELCKNNVTLLPFFNYIGGMRPYGTAKLLEKRRQKAIDLLMAGQKPSVVARCLNTSRISVHRWLQTYKENGPDSIKSKPTPGRTAKLSRAQRNKLVKLLLKGPKTAGYKTNLWTLKRIAQLIKKHFGVRYHPCHVWKLLQNLDWSCQKPEDRASQRDEDAIKKWKRYKWPWIKKKCKN